MIHKIGIISDTHDLLRPEVMKQLQGCERIFHAGDCSSPQVIDRLEEIAPVTLVQGNNDLTRNREWALTMPETVDFEICGIRIFMVHNKKFLPEDLSPYDLVIYGHSHKYEDKKDGNTRILNPGSCGPRRFRQDITMAIMMVNDGGKPDLHNTDHCENHMISIEKIIIPHPSDTRNAHRGNADGRSRAAGQAEQSDSRQKGEDRNGEETSAAELKLKIEPMIPSIMRDLAGGKTVSQIARKYKITEELSEQITRMYLTHPGVDADGILRRIGL